jgi:hypothetical protein
VSRAILVAAALSGCSKGPLGEVIAGEAVQESQTVEPHARLRAGTKSDLACQLRYDAPARGVQIELDWSFRAKEAPRERVIQRAWGPRSGRGTWFVTLSPAVAGSPAGWAAGDYTCTFRSEGRKAAGTILVE